MKQQSSNTVWHNATVNRNRREEQNKHQSLLLWFTGLSGSGKSTVAHYLEEKLHQSGHRTYVLDGDNVRHGLCGDLGFSKADREENIRRIGEMSKLFLDAGIITLTAFISPFRSDRDRVRQLVGEKDFFEIFCDCPITVCETRDVKGLYRKAREGLIKEFTGISSPYEAPENPDIILRTHEESLEDCALRVLRAIEKRLVCV